MYHNTKSHSTDLWNVLALRRVKDMKWRAAVHRNNMHEFKRNTRGWKIQTERAFIIQLLRNNTYSFLYLSTVTRKRAVIFDSMLLILKMRLC